MNYGDHPKNLNKLTNTSYSSSQQQYTDLFSCFRHLAGLTPLKKLFYIDGKGKTCWGIYCKSFTKDFFFTCSFSDKTRMVK